MAQVPLAKNGRSVAPGLKLLGHRRFSGPQVLAPDDRVPHADFVAIFSRHQAGAGGSAGRAGVEVGKAHTAVVQRVHVGRFDIGIAVASQVTVALVVGQDNDHVGWYGIPALGNTQPGNKQ